MVLAEDLLQVQNQRWMHFVDERTNVNANYKAYINDLLKDCHYLHTAKCLTAGSVSAITAQTSLRRTSDRQ